MSPAQDYGRALDAKKPISVRMDARPPIVDSKTAINERRTNARRRRAARSSYGGQFFYIGVSAALTLLQPGMRRGM